MPTLNDLTAIKAKLDRVQRDCDRAQGALDQGLKELKKKYGCDTIEEAQKLLSKKKREAEELRKKAEKALADLEQICEEHGIDIG